jgi:cell wall-associated NlpC family hydrolase
VEVQVSERDRGALRPRRACVLPVAAVLVLSLFVVAAAACGRADPAAEPTGEPAAEAEPASESEIVLTPESAREARTRAGEERGELRSRARVVELEGAGAEPAAAPEAVGDAPSPGAPTDAEVRAELRAARAALASFKQHLNTTAYLQTGPRARVLPSGMAVAPENAPDVVKRVIMAANEIAKFPYKWGGGHGAWRDDGYDCSGSVSFALAGAGLLDRPLTSSGFIGYGAPGEGRWITIYTNPGHVFMVVAGLRFDTSGQGRAGTRWQEAPRTIDGFVVRHVPGL